MINLSKPTFTYNSYFLIFIKILLKWELLINITCINYLLFLKNYKVRVN